MTRTRTITSAQEETLSFLKDYIQKEGQAPTITEIKNNFGLHSLRSVTQRLEALERKGLVARDRFQHRSIKILDGKSSATPSGTMLVPVIASAGCDAMEVYAQDEFGEYIVVDRSLLTVHTNIAAVKAIGDSMIDAGIHNGDYVIVEVRDDVEDGDRIVAILGNMAVIKRYQKEGDVVYLNPENKEGGYYPIVVSGEDSKVFGKVLSIIPGNEWVDDIRIEYAPEYAPRI